MIRIAHIINLTKITEGSKQSYLHIAQPLTTLSMLEAKQSCKSDVSVALLATAHHEEKVTVPPGFSETSPLSSYAYDHIPDLTLYKKKPLPRLCDILSKLNEAPDCDYFIYTNCDICVHPNFYNQVAATIEAGYDAFCINRRDIPKYHEGIALDSTQLPLITSLKGSSHVGIDCFVFKKCLLERINVGNVFIGAPPIGQVLKTQIEMHATNFFWFKDWYMTFHLGNDRAWLKDDGYTKINQAEAKGLFKPCFEQKSKPKIRSLLDKVSRRFGLNTLRS
jgi:hypothetical protein